MFSDEDIMAISPIASYGVHRNFSRTVSPKPFYYAATGPLVREQQLAIAASTPPEPGHSRSKPSNSIPGLALPPTLTIMATQAQSHAETPARTVCDEYNFDDSSVVSMLVQGCLFKVHRHFLERDSMLFRGILSTIPQGSRNQQPVEIPGVSTSEFKSLLDFFYQGMYRTTADAVPVSGWIGLLAASTALRFDRAREQAIAAIDKSFECVDAIAVIVLAEKYDVKRWLRPAYISLCKRAAPLKMHEAEKIGMETMVKLTQAREEFLREQFRAAESQRSRGVASPVLSAPGSPYWVNGPIRRVTSPSPVRRSPTPAVDEAERIVDKIFGFSATNAQ